MVGIKQIIVSTVLVAGLVSAAPVLVEERQTNVGSGNLIGSDNFQVNGLPAFPKRQTNVGSGNVIGSDNFQLFPAGKRQTNVGSGNEIGSGNFRITLPKRQGAVNFGSGNTIGSDNFLLNPREAEAEAEKRQTNILSGNQGGDGNFVACKRQFPPGNYGSGNSILSNNGQVGC